MKKIAILGCENSHADSFLKFIKEKEEFSDLEVIGVYSDDTAAAEKLRDKFGVNVMADYADAVGKIDGLVITARHGDNHYKYAKPYISTGVPMFIDKPITVSESDAIEFMQKLKENNVRVSGGSSLKHDNAVIQLKADAQNELDGKTMGGFVRAPYQAENQYGGFYFYAQHLVEMVCEIFGRFPLSVTAKQNGDQLHVLFHYADYDCVGLFLNNNYYYHCTRVAEKNTASYNINFSSDWFSREFKEFTDLLYGGEQNISYKEFISPVFILNAIERSMKSGKEEPVNEINL